MFPRVVLCADGRLCCDSNPQCCEAKLGVFLDENGNRVYAKATGAVTSYPPIDGSYERYTLKPSTGTTTSPITTSSSSTSSSSTTASSTTSSSTTTPTNEPAAETSSSTSPFQQTTNTDTSLSLKVGLGLGIPLAVLLAACAAWFFLRRRGRLRAADTTPALPVQSEVSPYMYSSQPGYSGVPKPPEYQRGGYPVELLGQQAMELDAQRQRYEMHAQ